FDQGRSMLAMNYRGPYRVRADQKREPRIEHPNDAIVRVTRSCICGSDLHLFHGLVPDTRVGSTFGHEFTGIVEEVGSSVDKLKRGDHVLVPFNIFCGSCYFCERELYSNCHNVNPAATAVGGIYGYSHTTGGYADLWCRTRGSVPPSATSSPESSRRSAPRSTSSRGATMCSCPSTSFAEAATSASASSTATATT